MKLFDGGRAPNPRRVRVFLAEKGHRGAAGARRHGRAGAQAASRSVRATRCSGCRCWNSTTAPSSPNPSPSAAISRNCIRSRRCSGAARSARRRSRCGKGAWSSTCSVASPQAFRHIHPAMKEWEIPQIPEWGEANKPKAVEFLKLLDDELANREFVAGDAYSIADITGHDRHRLHEAGAHQGAGRVRQRAALVSGGLQPAERRRLRCDGGTRTPRRRRSAPAASASKTRSAGRCRTNRGRCCGPRPAPAS